MKTNPASDRPETAAAQPPHAKPPRSRGAYRRQLTAAGADDSRVGFEARRAAALILEVLAGVRTPTGAAAALRIRLPRYYLLEQRAIQGLIAACQPRPVGRTVSTDRRLAQVERELARSQRELARQQALARTTQRALGLTPAINPSSTATRKAPEAASGVKRRRRKPSVRALRAARLLERSDSPGKEAPAAVQGAVGSPPAPGPAGGGSRPAALEAACSDAQGDHGGSHHAGRPKAIEHR